MRYTRKRRHRGGALIGEGGYGCVFRPALACQNEMPPHPAEQFVSKLMTIEHAKAELEEGRRVQKVLQNAPDSLWRHIELPADMVCTPGPISGDDLEGFERCEALASIGVRASNVNEHLDELGLLTARYAGLDLDEFWLREPSLNFAAFARFNKGMVDLLVRTIIPLRIYNVLHLDIKAGNVLTSNTDGSPSLKLIDWGLMTVYKPSSRASVPSAVVSRPLQLNLPWSMILFDPAVASAAATAFRNGLAPSGLSPPTTGRREIARVAANAALSECARGPIAGHLTFILSWLEKFYMPLLPDYNPGLSSSDANKLAVSVLLDYITEVLFKFTRADGTFMAKSYFHKVFAPNADIYGAITCYFPVIQKCWATNADDSALEGQNCGARTIGMGVWRVIAEYCITPRYAAEAIPAQRCIDSLSSLGPHPSPKLSLIEHIPCPKGKTRNPATRRCRKNR